MKAICKLSKSELAELLPELSVTNDLRFICKKCGRLAAAKKRLCKPLPIERLTADRREEEA